MEWVFIIMVGVVLWLIEKQFTEVSNEIDGLEIRVDELIERIGKLDKESGEKQ